MKTILVSLLLLCTMNEINAQTNYNPETENRKARKGFDSARFGQVNQWGVSSVLGEAE